MFKNESRFSHFLAFGERTTTINSYSAFGPSLRVIRFVNSLEIGFSMNQASCLSSEFTMELPFEELSYSRENGKDGELYLSLIMFLLKLKVFESIDNSTICSNSEVFPT